MTFQQLLIFSIINSFTLCWYFRKSGYFDWLDAKARQRQAGKNQQLDPYHYIKFERFVNGKSRPTTLQVYREDFRLLVAMCHDRQRAEDLIVDLVLEHPGQKGRWYVEKAIWDLERDRK